MDISTIIKEYREQNKMSLRDFAQKCGVSHSYVAMLEARKNSKTGEPIVPTLAKLQKIANGLDITLNNLFAICDDMPVSLSLIEHKSTAPTENELSEDDAELLSLINKMPPDMKAMYKEALRAALKTQGLI
jgi:transcriptional regulator with XRE-family HTH domain